MLVRFGALMQSGTACIVVYQQMVDDDSRATCLDQTAQPLPVGKRVGRKIQYHTDTSVQYIGDDRADDSPDLMRQE